MSRIIDQILNEVCLDPRVNDGIFKMDVNEHMDALRDLFVKRGLTLEDAINITNVMVEAKYPERQARRTEDNIIVTWATPEKMKQAMQKNPGKYVPLEKEKQQPQQQSNPEQEEPEKKQNIFPEPSTNIPAANSDAAPQVSTDNGNEEEFTEPVKQGNLDLSVEPDRGNKKPEPPPNPPTPPVVKMDPKTQEIEKQIVTQMMMGNDLSDTSKFYPQLAELYVEAINRGLVEAAKFLKEYIK